MRLSRTCAPEGILNFVYPGRRQETASPGDTMTTIKHNSPEALLAKLLANYQKPEDLIGENSHKQKRGA